MSEESESTGLLGGEDPSYGGSTDTIEIQHDLSKNTIPRASNSGRTLGWTSAYILVISRIIGSGIFAMPGSVLRDVGSIGASLVLWVIGSLLAWAGLAISMEFGCALPRSGNHLIYLEYTYPRPRFLAAMLVATQVVLLGFTANNCIVFSEYVFFAFRVTPSDVQLKVVAVSLLVGVTAVHGCFLRTGVWIQNILGWVKMALIIFMFFTGLFVVSFRDNRNPHSELESGFGSWAGIWEGTNSGWSLVSTAIFKISYAFAGADNLNNVMDEVKNPVQTLKTVGPSALLTAGLLYLLMNVAYFLVVPIDEIKNSGELVAALFCERVFGQAIGRTFLPLVIATSALGNVMVVAFALARLNQEVARQGFLPFSHLLATSRPFGSPLGGLIIHLIPSILVIIFPPSSDVYAFIADVEGYAGQFFILAVSIGLVWLRYREPELKRPYKAWLSTTFIRILISCALIAAPLFPPADGSSDVTFFYAAYALVAISVLCFGLLYWYVWTILLPQWKGARLEEQADVLSDGTESKRLVMIKKD